ncbi:MAG: hypothetical protein KIS81_01440 [Maricaulaceae bacterium]|nr:hypothetical protein [Maricaulaceae bacterium]
MARGLHPLKVVDLLYEAALDETLWGKALDAASELLGAEGANLEVIDKRTGWPVYFASSDRLSSDAAEAYVSHYARVCPRTPRCLSEPAGYVCHDRDVLSEGEMARNEFYADFLHPMGLKYFISGNLLNNDRYMSVVAAQRTPKQGHAGKRETGLLRMLIPHFVRAVQISALVASRKQDGAGPAAVIRASAVGILFLDSTGRVASLNPAAERIVREGHAEVVLAGGFFAIRSPGQHRRLAALVAEAIVPTGAIPGGVIVLKRTARLPLRITVARLPRLSPLADINDGAVAAIWLSDGARAFAPPEAMLRGDFGLTPAECRLALGLMRGRSPAEYAEDARIAMPTVRTHLARVLHKTGSRNQQDLIRLLAHLSAPQ